MDIHELEQFESVYKPSREVAFCWLRRQYVQLSAEEDHTEIVDHANDSLRIWQAAKAQAVPETQQALNDRLLVKSIREHVEGHIAETSVNDLFDKGWIAAMKCIQNNIDTLEAQEPKFNLDEFLSIEQKLKSKGGIIEADLDRFIAYAEMVLEKAKAAREPK